MENLIDDLVSMIDLLGIVHKDDEAYVCLDMQSGSEVPLVIIKTRQYGWRRYVRTLELERAFLAWEKFAGVKLLSAERFREIVDDEHVGYII